MIHARVAGAVLLLCAALAAPARAADVSAAEFRTLAGEAARDPAALERLRAVDSVDGATVDVAGALRGARGDALEARLRALAEPDEVVPSSLDPAAEARDVLAERRFHGTEVPGPFKGIFDWLGKRFPDIDRLPGPPAVAWFVLAAVLAGVAGFVARRLLTRRVRASAVAARALAATTDRDPRALERRADEAEAAGDLETALRLRFRAGLLRLDARGAIAFRPSISTVEVRRALRSEDFDALAATFDDVVYGGRPPAADDVADARERWPHVIEASA